MNYDDRQERAEMLVKTFRGHGLKIFDLNGKSYTGNRVADEIENMTDLGKNLVAIAGIVLHAIMIKLKRE